MASFGVALPISQNSSDGFTMLKSFKNVAKQNLKMLLLTSPGERVMEPEFGVGVRNYLFENFDSSTYNKIRARIKEQAQMYMPSIRIEEVQFSGESQDLNRLLMKIRFSIPDIGITEMLEFTI
jgi:phage baseplate assembly protein W